MANSLKTKILSRFLDNNTLTGGALEKAFGVSRTAVWKAVKELQKDGFIIEAKDRSGYVFLGDGDVSNAEIIMRNLKTERLGRSLEILKSVDSTNLYIKRKLPLSEGHTVIADEQTGGMGRKNRPFYSPPGGVYLSVVLKPRIAPQDIPFLTICAAVAVMRALEEVCGVKADVKWVNDIFYGGKKLCGISTEASFSAEILGVEHVITGIGINLGAIPEEAESVATSVETITNARGFKNKLITAVLNRLEETAEAFYAYGKSRILAEYRQRLFILNKTVTVHEGDNSYVAHVLDLNDDGALAVKDAHGTVRELTAGEISIGI